jgi:hypothetical protein
MLFTSSSRHNIAPELRLERLVITHRFAVPPLGFFTLVLLIKA